MRKTWAIVLAVVFVTIAPSQIANTQTEHAGRSVPVVTIEEDEPGWDCATMGNQICGDADWADEAIQADLFELEGPDGVTHEGCTIEVDRPSSHIICADGYSEEES